MKHFSLFGISTLTLALCTSPLSAHGPGHIHRGNEQAVIDEALSDQAAPGHEGHDHSARKVAAGEGKKSFVEPVEVERWWGASLTTGWESRHVHYGVNETGDSGAYTTEVGLWVQDFYFSVWSGFGTGSEFQEWDFTAAYNLDLDWVFLTPGYNLRYTPGIVEEGHASHEEEHGEEHGHEGEEHEEESHGHAHKTVGNEVFLVLGTNKIPYVTPSAAFIWDLNNTPGAFLEFRLDGEVPVYRDIVWLNPYALLGVNLGYNTRDEYGWNNFQFGLEATWRINKTVEVFGGVNYSVAMTALEAIGQDDVVWGNAGVRFSY